MGGEEASESYPWMVSLQRLNDEGEYVHFCGGSLVAPNYVLTAAHCVDNGDVPDRVQVGQHDLGAEAAAGSVTKNVGKVHLSPNYVGSTNDVALLKLKSSVANAELVYVNSDTDLEEPDTALQVIGWGFESEASGVVSSVLRHVSVPVVNQATCKAAYPQLMPTEICAGYENGGQDACSGDSGGPLFALRASGSFVQVGSVSYGRGCARATYVGVYARLSGHVEWIESIVGSSVREPAEVVVSSPTGFPTRSPTNFPTPPTAAPSVIFGPANVAQCFIPRNNPGWATVEQECQLPFYFIGRNGVTRLFDYAPTIAEAKPFGVDKLNNVEAGDTVMRWCPTNGVTTYNIRSDQNKKKWGATLCNKSNLLPTPRPTQRPTQSPTPLPTASPTTRAPTPKPTASPTQRPTPRPTPLPTASPTTRAPTPRPTPKPTLAPTPRPTNAPTTEAPSMAPTQSPTTLAFAERDTECQQRGGANETACSADGWDGGKCTMRGGLCRGVFALATAPAPTAAKAAADDKSFVQENVIVVGIGAGLAGIMAIVLVASAVMVVRRKRGDTRRPPRAGAKADGFAAHTVAAYGPGAFSGSTSSFATYASATDMYPDGQDHDSSYSAYSAEPGPLPPPPPPPPSSAAVEPPPGLGFMSRFSKRPF